MIYLVVDPSLLEEALHATTIPFAIYAAVKDKDGNFEDLRIEFMNEAGARSTGIAREEQVGKTLGELYPSRDKRLYAAYSEVLESGEPMEVETTVTTDPRTGEETNMVLSISIARCNDGLTISWKNITESKEADLHTLKQAEHDDLTGLLNPASFYMRLEEALAGTLRYGTEIGVMIIDIDNFKEINDTHGHLHGNKVLKQIAEMVQARVRSSDVLARFGGDEFVVLLHQATPRESLAVANEIRRTISRSKLALNGDIAVTASVGVYCVERFAEMDADTVLRLADQALYKAKAGGGDITELAPR